jgi:dephospho-CoA kinase
MSAPFARLSGIDALRAACGKPLIGLLGAIGSGKSAVAACFARFGCGVIDADAINRDLLERPEVREEVLAAFGPAVADGQGGVDRGKLADHVFSDAGRLRRLTDLLHPRVLERMLEQARGLAADREVAAVVLDVPLLAEVGLEAACDALVFVEADEAARTARLAGARRWPAGQAEKREKVLFSLDTKRKMSDYTVDNSQSLQATAHQVGQVLTGILRASSSAQGTKKTR